MTTANAALYRVSLPVPDIAQAARFYGEVEAPGERVSPGRHYFDCAGTILSLYDPVADGDGLEGGWHHHPSQYLYFAVADIAAMRDRVMASGASDVTDIREFPWGERAFYARDPFGSPIASVEESTTFRGGGFFK